MNKEKNSIRNTMRINEIANSPDKLIEGFKDFPFYDALVVRRKFARNMRTMCVKEEHFAMLEMYDNLIKEYFLLN